VRLAVGKSQDLGEVTFAPALECLGRLHTVDAFTHADAQGRYELPQPADRKFYGVIAFARDRLPYTFSVRDDKGDDNGRVAVPDMPLFPAAKVIVKPVAEGHLDVSPHWIFDRGEPQPEWLGRVSTSLDDKGHVAQVYWLDLNNAQPVYVPAGAALRMSFGTPYQDRVCGARCETLVRLAVGKSQDLGEVTFAPALPVAVRVVDRAGKPVEGVPVRRMYDGAKGWSVSHNTDEQGVAHFYVEPHRKGRFGVSELLRGEAANAAGAPRGAFDVADKPPAGPLVITLTPAHIQKLFAR